MLGGRGAGQTPLGLPPTRWRRIRPPPNRDDVRYIYATFPIVEREEIAAHGTYLSRDLCLAWMNALAAGDPDADIQIPTKKPPAKPRKP